MFHRLADTMTDKMDVVIDWIMDRLALFWGTVAVVVLAGIFLGTGAVSSLLPGYTGTGTITATEIKGSDCYVKVRLEDGSEGEFPFGTRWKCKEKEVVEGATVKISHGKATDSFTDVLKSVVQ